VRARRRRHASDEEVVPDWSERAFPLDYVTDLPVTRRLYERLRPEDVATVEETLEGGEHAALWEATAPPFRPAMVLSRGVWDRVPGVLERTGLIAAEPPPGVHAMSRGPLAAGGDYHAADMVVEALARAGGDIGSVVRALDFGCSSARTLRPLCAAFPDVEWHGVDPNREAIAWASEHVPQVHLAASDTEPPLAFPDAHFDLVYAISIWSHFGEGAAIRWLKEMHRIITSRGHLVLTIHGPQSIAFHGQQGVRPPEQLDEIARALHRTGFWYAPEFGDTGDHGVSHPEWGTAFMSVEWLVRQVTPAWHVASYLVGRNAGNQDVAVLWRPG
jgi:SAM-dependent methyltransferase